MYRRYNLKTDILLAILPTAIIIAVLILLNTFSRQQLLFSSLASSAFLIYLEPKHSVNSVRTLTIAQLSAALIGYLVYVSIGAGFVSAAIAMIISVIVMILTKAMHPPAVSTALIFAFQHEKINSLLMFFFAVMLLIILIGLQRLSLWLIKRSEVMNT